MKKIYILLVLLCLVVLTSCNRHDYEIVEQIDATCTTDGYKTEVCKKCKDTVTSIISKTGHYFKNKQKKISVYLWCVYV